MRHLPPVNASLILRVDSVSADRNAQTTETDQHELSRLLRYRLAVLEAALRRVDELRREAAKALQLRSWVADQIIQDVPSQIAPCEFDCRKTQCKSQEWDTCSYRLRAMAGQPCDPSTL